MTLLQSWAWHVYILPMMEIVNVLMKFAQVIDNIVCDYIVIVKICTKCVEIQLLPSRLQTFKSLLMWLQTFVGLHTIGNGLE
jgi:hypothetical protein